jgi:thymidine kinase
MNLLMLANTYEQQKKILFLLNLKLMIDSEMNLSSLELVSKKKAHIISDINTNFLLYSDYKNIDCVFVDEANLLTIDQIDQLRHITIQCTVTEYVLII